MVPRDEKRAKESRLADTEANFEQYDDRSCHCRYIQRRRLGRRQGGCGNRQHAH